MNTFETVVALVGLAAITVLTRSFFFISEREWPIPAWLSEGLRHAPLAALAAIIAPAVLMDAQGQFFGTLDSRETPGVRQAKLKRLLERR